MYLLRNVISDSWLEIALTMHLLGNVIRESKNDVEISSWLDFGLMMYL